jgi:hypothetical protein
MQVEEFCKEVNEPETQGAQVRSAVALPWPTTCVPATHTVLPTQAVAGLASLSHWSPVHATLAAAPPAQYVPALQAMHACAEDVVPDALCSVPAGQSPPLRHADWFSSVVEVPAGHTEQLRSAVGDGGRET